jgi:hypothetical protein
MKQGAGSYSLKKLHTDFRQPLQTVSYGFCVAHPPLVFCNRHFTQIAEHPLLLAPDTDADAWLVELASSPLCDVTDPRRSSVPSAAAAAAVMQGKREVSPRWVQGADW